MCYSLEASVNAGLCLIVVGAATVRKAWRHDRRMLAFATFPFVFSVHQFTEGVVWLSLEHPFAGAEAFRYLYTGIAFLLWPVLTPLAAALAETDPVRRRWWTRMYHGGAILALYLAVKLAMADGIDVSVVNHSLAYDPQFERPPYVADLVYLALTVLPLVGFDNRALRLFGVTVFATFVFALLHNRSAWYSLWCMSAAAFSLLIAFAIREGARETVEASG
jgi:hypothetical protein